MKKYNSQPVYDVRPIDKANFHPMAHDLIDQGILAGCVQIYIDVIGGRGWINVPETEISEVRS